MRYTEKEYDTGGGSLKDWLQKSLALVIVAPLRLVNEISSKIVFLNRSLIIKILDWSVILNTICCVTQVIIKVLLGNLDWYSGKIPLILQVLSAVILLGINIWYRLYDFSVYKHLDTLLPLNTESSADSIGMEDEDISNSVSDNMNLFSEAISESSFKDLEDDILTDLVNLDIPDIQECVTDNNCAELDDLISRLSEESLIVNDENDGIITTSEEQPGTVEETTSGKSFIDLSQIDEDLVSILNEDLIDDPVVMGYKSTTSEEIEHLSALPENENLEKDMDDSTDPSKYVSEENLFRFFNEIGADSFGEFSMFSDWEAPADFELTR